MYRLFYHERCGTSLAARYDYSRQTIVLFCPRVGCTSEPGAMGAEVAAIAPHHLTLYKRSEREHLARLLPDLPWVAPPVEV